MNKWMNEWSHYFKRALACALQYRKWPNYHCFLSMLGLVTGVSKCFSEGRWRRQTWNSPQMSTDSTWQRLTVGGNKCVVLTSGWAVPIWTIVRKTTGQRGHFSFFVFFFPNGAAFFTLDLEALYSISQGASLRHWLYFPLETLQFVSSESQKEC